MPSEIKSLLRSAAMPLLGTALALAAGGAMADDPNPYYIGASAGFTHDSNLFRVPNGEFGGISYQPQGDTYYSAGLLAGIDQPFGRQHFMASGNVKYNRFSHLTDLNNTSYGLNAQLDWQALDRLSGTLSAVLNENLASYSSLSQQPLTKRNVETDQQYSARMQYGIAALLSVDGGLTHESIRYSAPEYAQYETDEDAARIGLKYRPSALLTLGSYFRYARGRYPGVLLNGEEQTYDSNNVVLTANWLATGQSTLDARLSFGRLSFEHSLTNDFTGFTGQVVWTYKPTGKLNFVSTLSRDTGFASSFLSLGSNGTGAPIGDNSRLTTTVAVDATYAATAKISLTGGARYLHRSLTNSATLGNETASIQGSDNIQIQYLGITYNALRSLQLGCNIGHSTRSVSAGISPVLSYPYSDNNFGCSAQFVFQ